MNSDDTCKAWPTLFRCFHMMNMSLALTLVTTQVKFSDDPTSMNTSESPNIDAFGPAGGGGNREIIYREIPASVVEKWPTHWTVVCSRHELRERLIVSYASRMYKLKKNWPVPTIKKAVSSHMVWAWRWQSEAHIKGQESFSQKQRRRRIEKKSAVLLDRYKATKIKVLWLLVEL